ncbi:MAG: arsenate reductase ArsC, partial [Ignavibacteria bacterium]
NILVLCTGNSCRSQMAEGFLRSIDKELDVSSAGTYPALKVNPFAVQAMKEIGIDISAQYPKKIDGFLNHPFDYIITVCDNAKEVCPVFTGDVKNRLHIGFDDPADAVGSKDEILKVYRRVRDEIKEAFTKLYQEIISKN